MNRLTQEQLEFFNREGYLMVPDVFDPAGLRPLKDELHDIVLREAARLHAEGKLSRTYAEEPFETCLAKIYAEEGDVVSDIIRVVTGRGGGGHSGKALFELITHPDLLAGVESIIGPEIVGSSAYRIRPKVPGLPRGVVPWHQDSGYFTPHCDREMIVACWFPLVDATPENGCLQVLPGVHRREIFRHHSNGPAGYLIIADDDLPPSEPVTVPVPLGGVLFLTNRTPHCSIPNRTGIVRWSIDLRYQSADAPNNAGEDPEDFDPTLPPHETACYPPEADFVVQSRTHPDTAVKIWQEFNTIRQRYEATRPPGPQRWTPLAGE